MVTNPDRGLPGLQARNPSLPSPLADMPGEILQEIVSMAVTKVDAVDVRHMDDQIEDLLGPIADVPQLLKIGEDSVMHRNLFIIDVLGYGADNYVECRIVRPCTSTAAGFGISSPRIFFGQFGKVSEQSRLIRHLQIKVPILLHDTDSDHCGLLVLQNSDIDMDVWALLGGIPKAVPALEMFEVVVDNKGARYDYGRYWLTHAEDPGHRQYQKMEQMVCMEQFLTMVAAINVPNAKKSMTFIQDGEETEEGIVLEGIVLDGKVFETVQPAIPTDCV